MQSNRRTVLQISSANIAVTTLHEYQNYQWETLKNMHSKFKFQKIKKHTE